MARLNNLFLFLNDEKGRTLPKAKLFFYENNTFNFKATYSDKAKTSVNPNPVIADGAGRFPNIFLDTGSYRVVLQDKKGVEISTKDDVGNLISDGEDISSALNVTTATGTQTVAEMGDARVATISSIAEGIASFASRTVANEQQFQAVGFSAGNMALANPAAPVPLVYKADWPKSEHGITGFSPTVPAVSAQTGATFKERRDNYLNGVGETDVGGTGGFFIPTSEKSNVEYFGALGDDSTDNALPMRKADARGPSYYPEKTFRTSETISLTNDLTGESWKSVVKLTTADISLFELNLKARKKISHIKLVGTASTVTNGGVDIIDSTNCTVEYVEFEGFSSRGVWMHHSSASTSKCKVRHCYFHDWTATVVQDSAAVALMSQTYRCTVEDNIMDENSWHGILVQDNLQFTENVVVGHNLLNNHISAHKAYGIACYELQKGEQRALISGNYIENISGEVLSGTAGTGIYLQACGGVRCVHNRVFNCNTATTTETLAPAGIGVNGTDLLGDIVISNNHIENCQWYGVQVVTSTAGKVKVSNNIISFPVKNGIYVKNSTAVSVMGNTVTQDATATGNCILFFDTGAVKRKNLICSNNDVYAEISRPIRVLHALNPIITGNSADILSGASAEGMQIELVDGGTIQGNSLTSDVADGHMLILNNATGCSVGGNILRNANAGSRNLLLMQNTCSNTLFDHTNIMSDYLNVTNTSTGGNVEVKRSSAPTVKTWAVGDRVRNTAPSAGGNIGWVCTTAGTPGTWKTFGTIAA